MLPNQCNRPVTSSFAGSRRHGRAPSVSDRQLDPSASAKGASTNRRPRGMPLRLANSNDLDLGRVCDPFPFKITRPRRQAIAPG